jgi:hypothetical protein
MIDAESHSAQGRELVRTVREVWSRLCYNSGVEVIGDGYIGSMASSIGSVSTALAIERTVSEVWISQSGPRK